MDETNALATYRLTTIAVGIMFFVGVIWGHHPLVLIPFMWAYLVTDYLAERKVRRERDGQ